MIANKTTERGAFNFNPFPPRELGYGQFREPDGAGSPNEEKQKWVCSPARVPRGARRTGRSLRLRPPRRATRFAEGWNHPSPWRETYRGENTALPIQLPAKCVLPAPRAGDFPNFADFPGYTRSARHNESFVPDPRGCYPIGFCETIPARMPP